MKNIFFFLPADKKDDSEIARKKHSQKIAEQWVANEAPPSLKKSVKEFTKIGGNTTSFSMKAIKANASIRVEQDVDLVLKNKKLRNVGQPHEEKLNTADSRHKQYTANEDRIFLKDGLFFRKVLEERVASNSSKFSSQRKYLTKYSEACTENLQYTQEMPKE